MDRMIKLKENTDVRLGLCIALGAMWNAQCYMASVLQHILVSGRTLYFLLDAAHFPNSAGNMWYTIRFPI